MNPVTLLCRKEDRSLSFQAQYLLSSGTPHSSQPSCFSATLFSPLYCFLLSWVSKHSSPLPRVEMNPDFLPYK